jgi:hypothetical protein
LSVLGALASAKDGSLLAELLAHFVDLCFDIRVVDVKLLMADSSLRRARFRRRCHI